VKVRECGKLCEVALNSQLVPEPLAVSLVRSPSPS
jgi:hypothetical protein